MASPADLVPRWLRIVVGLLGLVNIAYGLIGYFSITSLYHDTTLIDTTNPVLRIASYEFSARNLAIGIALAVVTFIGAPKSIAIVILIRILIDAQSIMIDIAMGKPGFDMMLAIFFFVLEVFLFISLSKVIKKEEALAAKG